ncbi:MAG TPA: energy transducer TonB [Candidatus Wunengus sp. YC60]|uniref:energy transducer TonB n=1 Tax=Candidatus Wunengus sp. YC60 TaxID=3367697 RepID=UPI00402560B8
MTTDRFNYHRIKPGSYGIIKGFILALFIHGVLFFVGGKLFVKPVQYSVQSADGSIDVDLVTALPQTDADVVKSITPTTEKQQVTVMPQPAVDTVKPITPTPEKQQETVKTLPCPSQGTVRTKSKPGYFQNQPPKYPQLAKQMHQEGLVTLMVELDQKGMPVKVEVEQSSGYQLLDQAALEAVRHWRFQPERIGNIPFESKVTIPIRFHLEESDKESN